MAFYFLQPVLSGVIASDLPGLCHDQRLWRDWMVWMVNLLQGVLQPQRAQRGTHSHQKSEPVSHWWGSRLSRARGERTLQPTERRNATLHCVSTGHREKVKCYSTYIANVVVTQAEVQPCFHFNNFTIYRCWLCGLDIHATIQWYQLWFSSHIHCLPRRWIHFSDDYSSSATATFGINSFLITKIT